MPWVRAVLPAPRGPTRTTRSPGRSTRASSAPSARVSSTRRQDVRAPHGRRLGPRRTPRAGGRRPAPPAAHRSGRTGWPPTGGRWRAMLRPSHVVRAVLAGPGQHGPRPEEPLRRRQAQRHDHRRVEQLELTAQPAAAPRHLGGARRPVARRPALHHVEDGALRPGRGRPRRGARPAGHPSGRRRAGRSRPRSRRAPRRRAPRAAGRTAGTSPTTTFCRVAASSGQARQPRADVASDVQSGAAAAAAATSPAAASSRGGRGAATPAPYDERPRRPREAGPESLPPRLTGCHRHLTCVDGGSQT